METLMWLLALTVLLILAVEVLTRGRAAAAAWRQARGKRVISCPETGAPEAVEIDRRHAAETALAGAKEIRLCSCTRWPESAACGQECLEEIVSAADGCRVRSRLEAWYAGRICALCREPFETIHWLDHEPGLLSSERKALAWADIPAERVPSVLETHRPLCWDCYMAEDFRVTHPDLVIDDPLRPTVRHRSRVS